MTFSHHKSSAETLNTLFHSFSLQLNYVLANYPKNILNQNPLISLASNNRRKSWKQHSFYKMAVTIFVSSRFEVNKDDQIEEEPLMAHKVGQGLFKFSWMPSWGCLEGNPPWNGTPAAPIASIALCVFARELNLWNRWNESIVTEAVIDMLCVVALLKWKCTWRCNTKVVCYLMKRRMKLHADSETESLFIWFLTMSSTIFPLR